MVISFLGSSHALRSLARSWDLSFPRQGRGSPNRERVCDGPYSQSHAYLQRPCKSVAVPLCALQLGGGERQTPAFRATLGHPAACANRLAPRPCQCCPKGVW